jgi:uncharacterized protein YjiS (DUF1127 family)
MVRELIELIGLWRCRAHERRLLAAMNGHALHDIGITQWDAWREANKPFWRP